MRTCGDCVACCIYLRIEELDKAGLDPCSFLADPGPGCGIYGWHPAVCKGYRCTWLDGHGEEEDRPDRSGVLIDRTKRIHGAVECKPLSQGAADTEEGRRAIERVCKDAGAVGLVLSYCEQRLVRAQGRAP